MDECDINENYINNISNKMTNQFIPDNEDDKRNKYDENYHHPIKQNSIISSNNSNNNNIDNDFKNGHNNYKHEFNFTKLNGFNNNINYYNNERLSKSSPNSAKSDEWQKVLYKHQGVPDNYVPPTFLKDLKKNVNLRRFHFMEIIIAASIVTQQIILIVILILLFIYFDSYDNEYDQILFTIIALITMFLYSFIFISAKYQELIQNKSCIIFLIACFTMSPVLKTLTETISTDTIYAQCTIMAITHLAFHDYGIDAAIVSESISLNAIFFASTCLASRLSTNYHAFAFLIFSTNLFVLINLIYKSLSYNSKFITTIIFTIITLLLIEFTFGFIGFFISIVFVLFLNLICPYIFLRMQILKDNIYGPWDEAIIDRNALKFSTKNLKIIENNNNNLIINGYSNHDHCNDRYHSSLTATSSSSSASTTSATSKNASTNIISKNRNDDNEPLNGNLMDGLIEHFIIDGKQINRRK